MNSFQVCCVRARTWWHRTSLTLQLRSSSFVDYKNHSARNTWLQTWFCIPRQLQRSAGRGASGPLLNLEWSPQSRRHPCGCTEGRRGGFMGQVTKWWYRCALCLESAGKDLIFYFYDIYEQHYNTGRVQLIDGECLPNRLNLKFSRLHRELFNVNSTVGLI